MRSFDFNNRQSGYFTDPFYTECQSGGYFDSCSGSGTPPVYPDEGSWCASPTFRNLRSNIEDNLIVTADNFSRITHFAFSSHDSSVNVIPFVRDHAKAGNFKADFYLETLKSEITPTRLQYMQLVNISFLRRFDCPNPTPGGSCTTPTGRDCDTHPFITWPHVTANTLIRDQSDWKQVCEFTCADAYHEQTPSESRKDSHPQMVSGQHCPFMNPVTEKNAPGDSQFGLGPLKPLLGKWTGSRGYNVMAVPKLQNTFKLLGPNNRGQKYTETLVICPIAAETLNRGFKDPHTGDQTVKDNQILGGVTYHLTIYEDDGDDAEDHQLLHEENGMYMFDTACQVVEGTPPSGNVDG
eukprot:5352828-Prymnesium_polylepis.1